MLELNLFGYDRKGMSDLTSEAKLFNFVMFGKFITSSRDCEKFNGIVPTMLEELITSLIFALSR
jgi:hypothetical protein